MSSGKASKNRFIKCIILVLRDTGRHAMEVFEGRSMHRCAFNRFPNVYRRVVSPALSAERKVAQRRFANTASLFAVRERLGV